MLTIKAQVLYSFGCTYNVLKSGIDFLHFGPEPVPFLGKDVIIRRSEGEGIDAPHENHVHGIVVHHSSLRVQHRDDGFVLVVQVLSYESDSC